MYYLVAVIVTIGVFVWLGRLGADVPKSGIVTDRAEMKRLSRKLQSRESYRPCGKE